MPSADESKRIEYLIGDMLIETASLRAIADAVCDALIPDGSVVVTRAELDALRAFASAALAHEAMDEPTRDEHNARVDRVRAAIDGLRAAGFHPSELDPIPDRRDGHGEGA
jgi:predicted dinucleotide-utilizing enzyme